MAQNCVLLTASWGSTYPIVTAAATSRWAQLESLLAPPPINQPNPCWVPAKAKPTRFPCLAAVGVVEMRGSKMRQVRLGSDVVEALLYSGAN